MYDIDEMIFYEKDDPNSKNNGCYGCYGCYGCHDTNQVIIQDGGAVNNNKYPKISDKTFYEKIEKIYGSYTIPTKKKSFEEICFPKKYELQLPQQFVSEYINPNTPYKGILVYHRIGAGKTCTAIQIGEKWKGIKHIMVVLPASLKGNFRGEMRSLCAGNEYLKKSEREQLEKLSPSQKEYKKIIEKSDERIDKFYTIYSYNKFIELCKNGEIELKNTLLIIDEIQNMVSEDGTYYAELYKLIMNSSNDTRIVLLSATPMFDKPNEIALTMNLLKIPNELPTGKDFYNKFVKTIKNRDGTYSHQSINLNIFKESIRGYVSFFRGAPPYVFPELYIKYVKSEMGSFQYKAYKDILNNEEIDYESYEKVLGSKKMAIESLSVSNLPNNFFIGTRFISNIVFPNRMIGVEGFESLTDTLILKNLSKYSIKFYKIIKKIKSSKGKVFVYSSFKEYGGLRSFARILDAFGYKNYAYHGIGSKRYAFWTGDEDLNQKDEIKNIYNSASNLLGKQLKILLLSSAAKEGLSLLAVRQAHILEPYWNQSRLDQIIGRASRYCSHKNLPEEERNVTVYIYIATHPNEKKTVDEYMRHLADQKNKLTNELELAIKEAAVDCNLNKNANMTNEDDYYKCDK